MADSHAITVADGEEVAAVHHPAGSDDWLVCCHGFTSDKSGTYEVLCERAVEAGYDAVRFDFRGCGESDGAFVDATLSARIADLRAILDHFDPPRVALYGSSFGCKVAVHAAVDDDRVTALAGRAPVTYDRPFDAPRRVVAEEGEHRYDEEKAIDDRFFDDLDDYRFADAAAAVDFPVALFHGRDDETVDVADSLEAAGELDTDVLVQLYEGEGHRFTEAAFDRMQVQLFDWLARA